MLKVVYSGIDPLPDTFRDGARPLPRANSETTACSIHQDSAKCASKYEAKPQYGVEAERKRAGSNLNFATTRFGGD